MTREFKVSKFRCYAISFITFLAALSCGILLFLYAGNPKKNIDIIFCGVICLFSSYQCLKFLQFGNQKKSILSITPQGIIDNLCKYGFIHYSEIINIELITYKNNKMIEINVYDLSNILQRLSKFQQFYKKIDKPLFGNHIRIPTFIFQDDPKEIVNILRNALNEYQHQTK